MFVLFLTAVTVKSCLPEHLAGWLSIRKMIVRGERCDYDIYSEGDLVPQDYLLFLGVVR